MHYIKYKNLATKIQFILKSSKFIYVEDNEFFFFFGLRESFKSMTFALDDNSLLSDQDTNQFFMSAGLNSRFLIYPSETLSVELIGTYNK